MSALFQTPPLFRPPGHAPPNRPDPERRHPERHLAPPHHPDQLFGEPLPGAGPSHSPAYSPYDRLHDLHELHEAQGDPHAHHREPFPWKAAFWALLSLVMAVGFVYWLFLYDQARGNRMVIDGDPTHIYEENGLGPEARPNQSGPTINWGGKRQF